MRVSDDHLLPMVTDGESGCEAELTYAQAPLTTWGQPRSAVQSSAAQPLFVEEQEQRSFAPPDSRGRLSPRGPWCRRVAGYRFTATVTGGVPGPAVFP